MSFFKRIMSGFIIGGGMILPGVSGGVLAVILGVYKSIIDSVANIFKDFKNNLYYLIPIVLGVFLGVFVFSKILFFLFEQYEIESKYAFIGLILGGIPLIYRELETKGSKKISILYFFLTLSISLLIFIISKNFINIDFSEYLNQGLLSFLLIFIAGFIFASGKIIPGISSSVLLIIIGMYQFFLTIIKDFFELTIIQYLQLIPFVLGIIFGVVIFIKIIRYLMDKYYTNTYSGILGFVVGSIAAIYPGFTFDYSGLICLCLMIIGFYLSLLFSRVKKDKGIDK